MNDRKKNSIKRFGMLFVVVLLVAVCIMSTAVRTMLPPMRDYWEAVDQRFVSENIPIPAKRGDLLSDDGRVLSTSLPDYRLYIDLRVPAAQGTARRAWSAQSSWQTTRPPAQSAGPAGWQG